MRKGTSWIQKGLVISLFTALAIGGYGCEESDSEGTLACEQGALKCENGKKVICVNAEWRATNIDCDNGGGNSFVCEQGALKCENGKKVICVNAEWNATNIDCDNGGGNNNGGGNIASNTPRRSSYCISLLFTPYDIDSKRIIHGEKFLENTKMRSNLKESSFVEYYINYCCILHMERVV